MKIIEKNNLMKWNVVFILKLRYGHSIETNEMKTYAFICRLPCVISSNFDGSINEEC